MLADPVAFSIAPCSFDAVLSLSAELAISEVTAQVLVRRGHDTPELARAFLAADEAHDPSAFAGMDAAVGLILDRVRSATVITIHGDYDCDGVCSTAILVECLRSLGADVDWYLPDRQADGYGLSAATVERLAARGTGLLITADCAITAVEEIAQARGLGMSVVLTDHHTPRADGTLPAADALIHPAVCGYPCPELCATAVAAKLADALRLAAGVERSAAAERDLELVALATVADVVPLLGENRRLVREGLTALAHTTRPGLRALMAVAKVDATQIDERTLGFRLAPRINAAGRLYRPDTALELLLTTDEDRAQTLADELDTANAERRHVETRILFEAEAQVAQADADASAYVLCGEGWHPGVIGIVAARIAERHNRPAVLIALPGDGDPAAPGVGSGRSIPAFDLLGGLQAAGDELVRYGGHRAAAGLQVEPERVQAFREAFTAHAAAVLSAADFARCERADAIAGGDDLGIALAEELQRLGPFGAGNPEISLLLRAATLSDPVGFGGEARNDHVRFTVASGHGRARAVSFGGGARLPAAPGEPVDATFRLERNEWRGVVEPRLILRAAAPCAPAAIDVLGAGEFLQRALAHADIPLVQATLATPGRRVRDRRGRGAAATLAQLVATGEPVLVVCADVARRLGPLGERLGGFALCAHADLTLDPSLADPYRHVVVLDPPALAAELARCESGPADGVTHLAWGPAELRFAQHIHEREYELRAPLAALYRALRDRNGAAGDELEQILRGEEPHAATSPARAGRLLRVLTELELIELDRERRAASVLGAQRTELERSAAYRTYRQQLEEGRRSLESPASQAA